MTVRSRNSIKNFFQTGDYPTQSNFSDFIDSTLFLNASANASAQVIQSSISIVGSANVVGDMNVGGNFTTSAANFTFASAATLRTVTASAADNSTNAATTAFVKTAVGGGSSGMTLLSTINASGAASVTFSSTYITSTYNKYIIEYDNLYADAVTPFYLTVSLNNGSSYITSNYTYWGQYQSQNTSTITGVAASSQAAIDLGLGYGGITTSGEQMLSSGTLKFQWLSATSYWNVQFDEFININSGSGNNPTQIHGWGMVYASGASVNNIKFAPGSGTITGNFHLYGIAGT